IPHHFEFRGQPAIEFDRDEALSYAAGFFAEDPNAGAYVHDHSDRLIATLRLIPVGGEDQRLLVLDGDLHMPLLVKRYGGYGEIAVTNWRHGEPKEKVITARNLSAGEEVSFLVMNVDVERDRFPFPDGHFDVALRCEPNERSCEDPMGMLVE